MYTRCPQCQTVFRITAAQLKARDSMVRCGRCQHAFRADAHLVERPAKSSAKGTTRKRAPRKLKAESPPTPPAHPPEPTLASASPDSAQTRDRAAPLAEEPEAPLAPLLRPKKARTRNLYWALGSALLVLLLATQALVFYAPELARRLPTLKPALDAACRSLPCRKRLPIDMQRMDLVETQVTPHPRYDRALRIKAVIVNRAEHVQPYPLLEVSLMDSQGQLVARRTYTPREYLLNPDVIAQGLPPQVAVDVQLDITSPGAQASGYEILLLPPSE